MCCSTKGDIPMCLTLQNHPVCTTTVQSDRCLETILCSDGYQCCQYRYLWENIIPLFTSQWCVLGALQSLELLLNRLLLHNTDYMSYQGWQWPEEKCPLLFSLWSGTQMYAHRRSWPAVDQTLSWVRPSRVCLRWWTRSASKPEMRMEKSEYS